MRARIIAAAAAVLLADRPAVAIGQDASAAPARSCNTSMTGEAFPRQGPDASITVDTNSCNRELRAVAEC